MLIFFTVRIRLNRILEVLHDFKNTKRKEKFMKTKRELKTWVKVTLVLLPQIIILIQLFFIGSKINKIANEERTVATIESRCYCGK